MVSARARRTTKVVASLGAGVLVASALAIGPAASETEVASETFAYTGDVREFVVPAGVTELTVDAWGAAGGASAAAGTEASIDPSPGGDGGRTTMTIGVTPGETLTVVVGGRGADATATAPTFGALSATPGWGGYNGGGCGPTQARGYNLSFSPASAPGGCEEISFENSFADVVTAGGGGGGASDVRRGTGLDDRLVVAGGGGGGGGAGVQVALEAAVQSALGGAGGAGGGVAGGDGAPGAGTSSGAGGAGATQIAPGDGCSPASGPGSAGGATRSNGFVDPWYFAQAAGGGGGGWFGGGCGGNGQTLGQGGSGGGGGGSGYPSDADLESGVNDGDGRVVLSWETDAGADPGDTTPDGADPVVPAAPPATPVAAEPTFTG